MGNVIGEGSVLAGKYRLVRQIGVGAMGSVWVAENMAIEAPVAVKLLHSALTDDLQAVKRFELEAKSAARLRHRNIVSVFDLGALDDGLPFIVMELMEGESFERIMQRRGRLPPDELLGVVLPVLGALSVAHANQIVHRDLKPENIFLSVDPDGSTTPKIVDFGVSKMTTIDRQTRMTRTGMVVGTPIYMPPEQARGKDVDGRADLWAVGVIMYEALSGQLPYDGDNYNTLVASILTAEAKPLSTVAPEIDPELSALVMRALKRELDERYPSADVFATALGAWLVKRGMPVPPRCPEVSVVHSSEAPPGVPAAAAQPRRPELAVARASRAAPSIVRERSSSPLRGVLLGAAVTAVAMGGGLVAFVVARGEDPPPSAIEASRDAPSPTAAATPPIVPSTTPSPPPAAPPQPAAPPATHVASNAPVHVVPPSAPIAPAPPPVAATPVAAVNAPPIAPTPPPAAPALPVAPTPPRPVAPTPAGPATPAPATTASATPASPGTPATPRTIPATGRRPRDRAGSGVGTRTTFAPIVPVRSGPQLPPSPGF